ncbi:MotA/TolQ/ExbB proton channel family protein [Luteimonas sp. MC1750]|uniref:MotA/TolQ/ExbB proton channel family protein n=1 Tax=Luteimonas sp. MC1750 TaxID=2799326 RepID=UPI0018F0CBCE|nr:MotA/TolQ/ExbB proton channel family protein [Luteimonas sp. MC1750]MBJ6983823.1 MotA/TolQ/ExbB proton channel family protein [Luteimonas sp. MC1750]QQO06649.1 MotA/TolQ/ExbB proton channel family protein [Luteimonas sp. MC1750]
MGNFMEELIRGLSADAATDIFIWLTLAVFAFAVFQASKGRHSRFLAQAPSVMTSLGILGTFFGIVIGLLDFNVKDIDGSIGPLLEGMKTAFLTSLVGMLLAIVFKALDAFKFAPARDLSNAPDEVSPTHILAALDKQGECLATIAQSLSASEEGSVVGQLKMVRADFSDQATRLRTERAEFQGKLFTQMESFATLLSKSATEVVIEALRQVIVDFNTNLTEQFGENFKALDESVKKLVVWQQQYAVQVEAMGEQFAKGVEALETTGGAITLIKDECKHIPEAMDELREVLDVNQHQIQELQRHLEAFVAMRNEAVAAVPEIQGQIENMVSSLGSAANDMSTALTDRSEQFATHVERSTVSMREMAMTVANETESLSKELTQTVEELAVAAREMVRSLESAGKEVHEQISACTEEMAEAVRRDTTRMLGGVEQQISAAVDKTGESVNAQLQALDNAVGKELERVMNRFGTSVAQISDGFSQDYLKLIRRLSDLSKDVA